MVGFGVVAVCKSAATGSMFVQEHCIGTVQTLLRRNT